MDFNRGSEWNKWDLHIHTKGTNKNDQFRRDITFDEFCIDFFKKAVENNIKVIGITDYFSIENYNKVKEFITRVDSIAELNEVKEDIQKIYLIPNIELRMLPSTDRGKLINIHCLFNPSYIQHLEDDFFSTLEFDGCKMTRTGLIRLGRKIDASLTDEDTAYKKGINNFVITPDKIESLLNENKDFKQNTIIVVSNNSTDGASGLRKHYDLFENDNASSLDGIRRKIYSISDMIFSPNVSDIKYFLGLKNDSRDEVISKCGSLKTCIHGSDAHKENKLFKPDNNRYCWIKAHTTFEGLKQLIYEPSRVFIGEDKPEMKTNYEVIKSIQIVDSTNTFTNKEIGINANLNSIIGGKSSGKSLLLYILAKTVLPHDKFDEIRQYKNFVEYDNLCDVDCEVKWEDGQISRLKSNDTKRYIEYIPQMYLNHIAENREQNIIFKKTVDDLLYKKTEYKESIDDININISSIKTSLTHEIDIYFTNKNELERLKIELSTLGDKKAINANITKYTVDEKTLKDKSSLTEDDEVNMAVINDAIFSKEEEKKIIVQEISLKNVLAKTTKGLSQKIEHLIIDEFSTINISDTHTTILDEYKNNISKELILSLENYKINNPIDTSSSILAIKVLDASIIELQKKLIPFNSKIQDQKQYLTIQNELIKEHEKLNIIILKEKDIALQIIKLDINKFIDIYEHIFNTYKTIILLNNPYKNIGNDLELVTNITFDIEKFYNNFSDFIAKNQSMDKIFDETIFTNESKFLYDENLHIDKIKIVLNKIFDGSVNFNKQKTLKDITKALFDDYFKMTYDLKQGNDLLNHMSPGKKGIILFQLFLEISSSKVPILIDQPEDNLDNRTVYETLNEFIKNKKIDRQIIMVSHNSNLVVSTDSENIIIANQNGHTHDDVKFDYINGALEETKNKDITESNILQQQGIREHVCEILEGGIEAFQKRERKYGIGVLN